MPGGKFALENRDLRRRGILAVALSVLLTSHTARADWLTDLAVGSELGGNPALDWLLEKKGPPLAQRASLYYLDQTEGKRYRLGYRAQFNISSSFYHFARLTTGADPAIGIDARHTAVLALGNSPFRGRTVSLALEAGIGFQQLELESASAERADDAQTALFLGGRLAHSIGDGLTAELAHSSLNGSEYADLTTSLSAKWRLYDNATLRLTYRVHRINFYRHSNLSNENVMLSIGYRFDWESTRKRWPDT